MAKNQSEVLLTRKRWAAYMLPSVLAAAIAGAAAARLSGQARFVVAPPLGLLGVWAIMHFLTPRDGMEVRTIQGTPGAKTMLWFCGASVLLTGILMAVDTYWLGHKMGEPLELYHVAVFAPAFLLLFTGAFLEDRANPPERDELHKNA